MSLNERPEGSLPSTSPAFVEVRGLFLQGKSREARALLDDKAPVPVCSADAVLAAEVWASTGAFTRAAAVLRWSARRFGLDDDLAVTAAARAALSRGHERAAKVLLTERAGRARDVLRARLARAVVAGSDDDDADTAVDVALTLVDPALACAAALAALGKAPTSTRARLVCARMLRARGQLDEGRALLKEAVRSPLEDARVEVALALALVADDKPDEAALATARLRARFADLAKDRDLRLLLSMLAWSAGRGPDAVAVAAGATDLLLVERAAAVFLSGGPAAAEGIAPAPPRPAPAPPRAAPAPPRAAPAPPGATPAGPTGAPAPAPASPAGSPRPPREPAKELVFAVVDAPVHETARWRQPVAVLMLLACAGYVGSRIYARVIGPPEGSNDAIADAGAVSGGVVVVVDAGAAFVPRIDGARFRALASACGVAVPGIVDVGLPLLAVGPALAGQVFNERPFSPAPVPVPLDDALLGRPGMQSLGLGAGGRTEPAFIIGDDAGLTNVVVGYALFPATAERPTLLGSVDVTQTPLQVPTPTPCPGAPDAARSCFRAIAACEGVDVVVRTLCPADAVVTDAASLGPCLLDAVVVTAR